MDAISPQIYGWVLSAELPPSHEAPSAELALLVDDLVASGILRRCDQPLNARPRRPTTPEHDFGSLDIPPSTSKLHQPCVSIMTALASADWSLRCVSMIRIINRITSRSTPDHTEPCRADLHRAATLTWQFRNLRPWYPRDYLCLFDSLALLLFLLRHGIRCNWIFGVKEDPFAAHCWLQLGSIVLNEHLDRARLYTPIMMV